MCDARTPLPSPAPNRLAVLVRKAAVSPEDVPGVFRAFALPALLDYDLFCFMTTENPLPCDGCGQPASSEHIAKRLQRLEWTTRYRPVHIGTLFVGAIAPRNDSEFLYSGGGEFAGEAGIILEAAGLSATGKAAEATLAEFQRGGFLLAYVLDCPLERSTESSKAISAVLEERLPAVLARIRRSWKPKKLVPISRALQPVLGRLEAAALGCIILLDDTKPFALDGDAVDQAIAHLRQALAAVTTVSR